MGTCRRLQERLVLAAADPVLGNVFKGIALAMFVKDRFDHLDVDHGTLDDDPVLGCPWDVVEGVSVNLWLGHVRKDVIQPSLYLTRIKVSSALMRYRQIIREIIRRDRIADDLAAVPPWPTRPLIGLETRITGLQVNTDVTRKPIRPRRRIRGLPIGFGQMSHFLNGKSQGTLPPCLEFALAGSFGHGSKWNLIPVIAGLRLLRI